MKLSDFHTKLKARADEMAKTFPGLAVRVEMPVDQFDECRDLPTFHIRLPDVADLRFVPDGSEPEGLFWLVTGMFKGERYSDSFCVDWGDDFWGYCESAINMFPYHLRLDEQTL